MSKSELLISQFVEVMVKRLREDKITVIGEKLVNPLKQEIDKEQFNRVTCFIFFQLEGIKTITGVFKEIEVNLLGMASVRPHIRLIGNHLGEHIDWETTMITRFTNDNSLNYNIIPTVILTLEHMFGKIRYDDTLVIDCPVGKSLYDNALIQIRNKLRERVNGPA